jgi:hypothetical protein
VTLIDRWEGNHDRGNGMMDAASRALTRPSTRGRRSVVLHDALHHREPSGARSMVGGLGGGSPTHVHLTQRENL